MDPRLDDVPVVAAFGELARPVAGVIGLYVGGSLATGDYRPGISDLDLTAVIAEQLTGATDRRLRQLHEDLRRDDPGARKLHCVYVPRDLIADEPRGHLTWAHGALFRRPLSGIARAELLRGGITVFGPPPAELLPPVDDVALRAAARGELTGYWRRAVRRPWLWLGDSCVDLGLITVARAEATIVDGSLLTKTAALHRLHRFDVPDPLIREIGSRRRGKHPDLTLPARLRRAHTARRLVARGIRTVTRPDPPH